MRDGGPINPSTFVPVAAGTSNALRFGQTEAPNAPGHPIAGYVDAAAQVESTLTSEFWRVPNRVVNDGAATSSSVTVTSATAAFSAADSGREICIVGAGTAGADYYNLIDTVTNSTTIQLPATSYTAAPATTVSGAQLIIGTLTRDGLHPSGGNAVIAAGIQTALLTHLTN